MVVVNYRYLFVLKFSVILEKNSFFSLTRMLDNYTKFGVVPALSISL